MVVRIACASMQVCERKGCPILKQHGFLHRCHAHNILQLVTGLLDTLCGAILYIAEVHGGTCLYSS